MTFYPLSRVENPIRFRRARSNGSLGSLAREIEEKYGLPAGSVRIIRPDRRKMRSDATVHSLKKVWRT